MRRLLLRWVGLLVFVLVLGVAFVNLGEWQLRRLDQRRAENAVVVANQDRPPAPYAEIADEPVTDEDEWRRVTVTGTFDPENQFQVRYRNNDDMAGYEVVTPLRTESGVTVLVDRGFFPVGRGARIPNTPPPAPTGEVEITAHLRPSEEGAPKATDPVNGQVRLINTPALADALPYPVTDGYLGVLQINAPQEGDPVPVLVPPLDEGPHFWYAMQWFLFAGIAAAGLVVFIRYDLQQRRQDAAASTAPSEPREPATKPSGTMEGQDADHADDREHTGSTTG